MNAPRTLQSPLLVGRDEALSLAERMVADARAGRGGLLMLAGEAGIGKTRLLKAAVRHALLAEFHYSKSDVAPQDQLVPLASVNDLARAMEPEEFGDLGPRLLAMRGGKGLDSLASRRILIREIAAAILDATDHSTVLAFEDLQWADELTLEVIGDLARHAADRPLLLITAYRLDELPLGSIHREWRSRLLTQRHGQEVRLDRLARDETALVTSLILGTGLPASRDVADAVYARTNGIPLHIEELLAVLGEQVGADGRSIRDASVPDTIEDAVVARVQRLSEDARAVARAGAVMGRCFAPAVLAGIMDRHIAELDEPLGELVDSSILFPFEFIDQGYFDFRHQLLRDALYATVPTAELRRLHARAAEFGAQLVGASEIHASIHYERAGLKAQAFRAALSGARAAAAVSSRHEAFELYRRTIANLPDDVPVSETAAIYDEYMTAAMAVDDMRAIEEAAALARRSYLEAGDALGAAKALIGLYIAARRDVHPRSERQRLLAEIEAELHAAPESRERAIELAYLKIDQGQLDIDTGRLADARERLVEARRMMAEVGESELDVDFFESMVDVLTGRTDAGLLAMLSSARAARDANAEGTGVTAFRMAAAVGIRVMDYPTAEMGLVEGLRYADEIEQSYCRHIMSGATAHLAWAAGRWDEAVKIAELELVNPGSRRSTLGSRDALAYVALGRGNVDRARSLLDASLAISRPAGEVELILPALWGLAEAALVDGDPARARNYCEEAFELAQSSSERPLLVPFVVTGVRAALADRRPEQAERWLARVGVFLEKWPGISGHAMAHGEGLVRLAAGSLVAARASLETAVAGWDARARTWESSFARLDLAGCLLRSNRHVEATRLIAEVADRTRDLASPPIEARIEELQRQSRGRGGQEEAWYPLTAREFEVARQIAAGMTNAEIATELFVSPKTVSAHVEHILAKLGANRRAEIAAWASTVAQPVA